MGRLTGAIVGTATVTLLLSVNTDGPVAATTPKPKKVTKVFHFTGHQQEFKVPLGVTRIHVVAIGGRGGSAGNAHGGLKVAKASADLRVRPRQLLYVEVGGNGQNAGPSTNPGFNGGGPAATIQGGNGGGASDVRTVSRPSFDTAQSLASRLIVAGGGGGAGGPGTFAFGGAGGNAAQPGQDGLGANPGGGGGAGDSLGGGDGGTSPPMALNGTPGFFGAGGGGADPGDAGTGGGGGGGGWFGGGGGGGTTSPSDSSAGGGGGGSSFFAAGDGHTSLGFDTSGVPSVRISYVLP